MFIILTFSTTYVWHCWLYEYKSIINY